MTTIQADSATDVVEQLMTLILQGGTRLGRQDVPYSMRGTIGQFGRIGAFSLR